MVTLRTVAWAVAVVGWAALAALLLFTTPATRGVPSGLFALALVLGGYILLLYAQRERAHREVDVLQRFATAVAQSLKMDDVVKAIAEAARQVLGVDRCGVFLADPDHRLGDVFAHNVPEDYLDVVRRFIRLPRGGLARQVEEPLFLEDTATDPRLQTLREQIFGQDLPAIQPQIARFPTMALLPLWSGEKLLGALVFYHDRPRRYPAADRKRAEAIAGQAATAVKNALLLAQAQRRAAEAALINRVMSALSGGLDLRQRFHRVVDEIAAAFGYTHVSIYRLDGDVLYLQAQVGEDLAHPTIPITRGIIGRVARTGQPALVPDVRADRDYLMGSPAIRSEAAVPIAADHQVIGVLNVECDGRRQLTRADLDVLLTLSHQIAVAVRNAILYEEARRARDELAVLYEAVKAVSGNLELDAVLNTLVQVTCRAFGYEYGAILLTDDRSGDMTVEAIYGYAPEARGVRIPAGKGITGAVQRSGKPEVVDDVRADPRYVEVNPSVISEIAVPLISEGRVIGVFNVESTRPAAFGRRDLELLTSLASQATIAIRNARLFEQTRHLAITDGLTELYNHRYLHELFERLLDRCTREHQPLAVVMLEIDRFKRFNDTYGHRCGDEVLRTVADLLRRGSRPEDLVARYGGDEFMLVLPNTTKATAQDIAERLRRIVEAYPLLLAGSIMAQVTLSVGVAASPEDGLSVDELVDAVDRAQYAAKRSGGNKVQAARELP